MKVRCCTRASRRLDSPRRSRRIIGPFKNFPRHGTGLFSTVSEIDIDRLDSLTAAVPSQPQPSHSPKHSSERLLPSHHVPSHYCFFSDRLPPRKHVISLSSLNIFLVEHLPGLTSPSVLQQTHYSHVSHCFHEASKPSTLVRDCKSSAVRTQPLRIFNPLTKLLSLLNSTRTQNSHTLSVFGESQGVSKSFTSTDLS